MTHARRLRRGYTMRELIVIVVVLFVLVGMLLPYVLSARRPAHSAQCINHQHNISLALIRFEFDRQHYPGWAVNQNPDAQGYGGREVGWVFALLPYLDRTDIYNHYGQKEQDAGTKAPAPEEHLPILVCPDDVEARYNGTMMSYVVNTGYYHDAFPYRNRPEHPALGVFTYQYRSAPSDQRTALKAADVKDGLAQTLMLTENIDAGTWVGRKDPSDNTNGVEEGCVGFAWLGSSPIQKINVGIGLNVCNPRPSSYHPGGVVATFCDGHTRFLSEDIDGGLYERLCTPQRAIVDFKYQPAPPQPRVEGDADF